MTKYRTGALLGALAVATCVLCALIMTASQWRAPLNLASDGQVALRTADLDASRAGPAVELARCALDRSGTAYDLVVRPTWDDVRAGLEGGTLDGFFGPIRTAGPEDFAVWVGPLLRARLYRVVVGRPADPPVAAGPWAPSPGEADLALWGLPDPAPGQAVLAVEVDYGLYVTRRWLDRHPRFAADLAAAVETCRSRPR